MRLILEARWGFLLAGAILWGIFGAIIDGVLLGLAAGAVFGAILASIIFTLLEAIATTNRNFGVTLFVGVFLGGFFGGCVGAILGIAGSDSSIYGSIFGIFIGGLGGLFVGAAINVQAQKHSYQTVPEVAAQEGVAGQLTASDLIVLREITWRYEDANGISSLQVRDPEVSHEHISAALAAAVLASEEAGAIRLEVAHEKAFFGRHTNLYVIQGSEATQWPVGRCQLLAVRC